MRSGATSCATSIASSRSPSSRAANALCSGLRRRGAPAACSRRPASPCRHWCSNRRTLRRHPGRHPCHRRTTAGDRGVVPRAAEFSGFPFAINQFRIRGVQLQHKPNQAKKTKRSGRRQGSLGRTGGGRALAANPDEVVTAKPVRCAHCQAALGATDPTLHGRYDKIDLPKVAPVVTRVEHYAGQCPSCGGITLAPLPEGLEPGTPFSLNIVALAMYLRFVHAVSYRRLSRLLIELFGLAISEDALDAAFRRGKPEFDADVANN